MIVQQRGLDIERLDMTVNEYLNMFYFQIAPYVKVACTTLTVVET